MGLGVASPATSTTEIMSSTWASVVPAGTVPKDYPRHFDGLSGRPRASVSRRSPRSRAHRGHRAGFVEVGSGGDQGQHIEVSAGHAHQLQGLGLGRTRRPGRPHSGPVSSSTRASVGREPVTAEDCGSDCGSGVSSWARTPTRFESPALHRTGQNL